MFLYQVIVFYSNAEMWNTVAPILCYEFYKYRKESLRVI